MWRGVKTEHRGALIATGFVVLVPAALAMVVLRPTEALIVLAVAWIADTGAYFAGRRWGRRKLAPAISPGKTWEGAAGGLIGAAAYAMILSLFLAGAQASRMAVFLGAAALLVMVSIVGDLFESAAKRQAGVKDSGALLPGHGGMLDRIDSACAILPVGAALMLFKVVR
jgi:phosphatidate cytidylyltransferase